MAARLRVCYFGTYRAEYSRNQIMIEGLERSGVDVVECHVRLWQGIEDRVRAASGGWLNWSFLVRVARTYWHLLRAYGRLGDYDVMVLGYPGQVDVALARVLTWLRRKPLVLDVFMSVYLIASERGLTSKSPFTARLIYWLERLACVLPDRLILDTREYVQWFEDFYGLDPTRFRLVPTGADDRVFVPTQASDRDSDVFRALYYGTFIPNHGTDNIVEAAKLLRDERDIQFELVGRGPTKSRAEALVGEYGLTNVVFTDWIDKQDLPAKVAGADVCLGVFGATPQSTMTIQNKIYEALAMGKPLITGDSPTMRTAFADGEHLLLCRREDPASLAETILRLRGAPELQRRLAKRGYDRYAQSFVTREIGRLTLGHLEELVRGEICSAA